MKKTITTLLIVLFTTFILAFMRYKKQNARNTIPHELIIGTSADLPPITFWQDSATIAGYDIDVIQEVARRLGIAITIKDLPFETLTSELLQGNIHLIAAGMSPTPEREQLVQFSLPYLTADPFVVIAKKNGPKIAYDRTNASEPISGLTNKTVVTIKGYAAEIFFSQIMRNSPAHIVYAGNQADAIVMLIEGKADAFITTSSLLKPILDAYPEDTFKTVLLAKTDQSSAFALPKERKVLLGAINKALSDMQTDGTLESFKQKWQLASHAA